QDASSAGAHALHALLRIGVGIGVAVLPLPSRARMRNCTMDDSLQTNGEIEQIHWLLSEAREVSQRILHRLQQLRDRFPQELANDLPQTPPSSEDVACGDAREARVCLPPAR